MTLPTPAIQTAMIARLRKDIPLQGLMIGAISPTWNIFDGGGIPTNQSFPYMVIYPIAEQQGTALTLGLDAIDTYVQISIFTQSGGFSEARRIAIEIYSLLQTKPLDLSGSGLNQFFLMFENKTEMQESDGLTQQITMRFKCMTQG